MSADAAHSTSARERMRDYRRRRRHGYRCLRVLLHEEEIGSLITRGFLGPEHRHDQGAIEGALDAFVHDALDPAHQ
jgi:hypothetical protein